MAKFFEIYGTMYPVNTKKEIDIVKDILNELETMAELTNKEEILDYRKKKLIALGDLID